jgi:hypothetical protein
VASERGERRESGTDLRSGAVVPNFLHITDDKARDATIQVRGPARPPARSYVSPDGCVARSARLVKATEGRDFTSLSARDPDPEALARALVAGDPEVDVARIGRRVGPVNQVWVGGDGKILYAARRLSITYDPAGAEVSREDFVDVEATVAEDLALPWSGRLVPIDRAVRSFALGMKLQLQHINGLTFDFLHELARTLQGKERMLVVGAGARGGEPLIFHRNGSKYRGFLEGRADAEGFLLVLHLSNLELKRAAP